MRYVLKVPLDGISRRQNSEIAPGSSLATLRSAHCNGWFGSAGAMGSATPDDRKASAGADRPQAMHRGSECRRGERRTGIADQPAPVPSLDGTRTPRAERTRRTWRTLRHWIGRNVEANRNGSFTPGPHSYGQRGDPR